MVVKADDISVDAGIAAYDVDIKAICLYAIDLLFKKVFNVPVYAFHHQVMRINL